MYYHKGTPGPWTSGPGLWVTGGIKTDIADGGYVTEICQDTDDLPTIGYIVDKKDVELAAAAPELFDALNDLLADYLIYRGDHELHFAARDNRTAIKKARLLLERITDYADQQQGNS